MKRLDGGRGLLQLEMAYKISFIGINKYLGRTEDWLLQCALKHEEQKKLYSITKKAKEYLTELRCEDLDFNDPLSTTTAAKKIKQAAKVAFYKQLLNGWKNKPLHGKFPQRTLDADVDQKNTFVWLKSSSLKAETEGFITAAQDQSIKMKNYITKIMKTGNDSNCRFCGKYQETVDHLVAGCPVLAKREYLVRHNKVASYMHWKICQHYGLPTSKEWYKHEPKPVTENDLVTVLWDFAIQTDKTIIANRPDIVIRDKKKKTCILIDVSVPSDTNTSLKTFEKISKYKDLEIELSKSWKYKMKTVPAIIGALGIINKSTTKYLQQIPGNINFEELQKIALLGTANILRKALSANSLN